MDALVSKIVEMWGNMWVINFILIKKLFFGLGKLMGNYMCDV